MSSLRLAAAFVAAALFANTVSAAPIPVQMAVGLAPLPLHPTGYYTASGTVTTASGGLPVTCGSVSLVFRVNDQVRLELAGNDRIPLNGSNTVGFSFAANVAPFELAVGDKLTIQASYFGSGVNCDYGNLTGSRSPQVDYEVEAEPIAAVCPPVTTMTEEGAVTSPRRGVYITINNAAGNHLIPGESIAGAYEVSVLACEDVSNVTAQGGVNGWASSQACTAEDGVCELRKATNRNNVFFWTIGAMRQGDVVTNRVDMQGFTKSSLSECGKLRTLNGAWSALFTADIDGLRAKSEYSTDTATMQVYCD